MQLSHVTAFWLRLAGNVLLDLFLYVHSATQLRARDYTTFNPFEPLGYMHLKPSSHSGRIVGKPEVMVRSGLLE